MIDTSHTPADLDAIERDIYIHGAAISRQLRDRLATLIAELRSARAGKPGCYGCAWRDAMLAARTSIGPDSERIRELEAENAKLRQAMRTYGR